MAKPRKDAKRQKAFGASLFKKTEQAENEKKDQRPANGKVATTRRAKSDPRKTKEEIVDGIKSKKASSQQNKQRTSAEEWEKARREKINIRHKKMHSTIMKWEDREKTKEKQRLNRAEIEVSLKRARVSREYQLELFRIKKIAEAAKYLAEERKRNEQSAVRAKAKKHREMGKIHEPFFGVKFNFPRRTGKKQAKNDIKPPQTKNSRLS